MSSKETLSSKERDEKKRKRILKNSEKDIPESPVAETRDLQSKMEMSDRRPMTARELHEIEELEVDRRDPEDDVNIQSAACDEVRQCMSDIAMLKQNAKGLSPEAEARRVHGTLQFVTLKRMNRQAHIRCKKAREATQQYKQQIDQKHLQLQNLLYEVSHLQKEITKCLAFQSDDESIKLISVADFYVEAPEEVSRPDLTKKDLHQQMLARLDWELDERKRLTQEMKERQKSQEEVKKEMQSKADRMNNLQPQLQTILESTRPVQDYLSMPFDETREQHALASHLPRPLYVLFQHSSAFAEACDPDLKVVVEGDIEVAKALNTGIPENVDEESDGDEDNEEAEKQSKKRRRRVSQDRKTVKRNRVLKPHPLTVHFKLNCKEGSVLQLSFQYLLNLNVVTVKVKLVTPTTHTPISGGDLLSASSLLSCLFSEDLGTSSPNPSNNFYLQRMGMGLFSEYVSEVGQAYTWVQTICGLQFLTTPGVDEETPAVVRPVIEPAMSFKHMESTIQKLRQRVAARLALQKQLEKLERGNVIVSPEFQKNFPAKITSRLLSWKRCTYSDFEALPYTELVIKYGLAKESHLYFTGCVDRPPARVVFHVCVGADYPTTAPVFVICIKWHKERNSLNDQHIADMEAELNFHYDDLVSAKSCDQVLTNQIARLLLCIDVYLESESENSDVSPKEFVKERIFTRLSKGPDRRKPYMFNSAIGFFHQRH